MQRRRLLQLAGVAAFLAQPFARLAGAAAIPAQVAGVALPRTARALAAAAYAREHCPEYLFNHCMRTYLFGALRLAPAHRDYLPEDAFIAAALHDLGLLPAFESARGSFETDGADAAEQWARHQGIPPRDADLIWHAVQMHDGRGRSPAGREPQRCWSRWARPPMSAGRPPGRSRRGRSRRSSPPSRV
jgi:hypothetical protein